MKAKRLPFILALLTLLIAVAQATPPPMTTPPKPPFPAWEAAKLADAYVAKTFPQFPDLYCSEVDHIDPRAMLPVKTAVWSLRYLSTSGRLDSRSIGEARQVPALRLA